MLKPSEVAPLDAFILAEIIDEVGLPAGVFNLVTGTGPVVGEAIAAHPDVDMVSFTGSTRAGKRVAELAAPDRQAGRARARRQVGQHPPRRPRGEELDKAVRDGVGSCYLNSGQTCTALTRMLVPAAEARRDRRHRCATRSRPCTRSATRSPARLALGPLISDAQRDRVRGYIQKGIDEGATLVTGGAEQPEGLRRATTSSPTVFANVDNDMTIAQEEIFGPVLSIIPYDDEDDAVRIANDIGLRPGRRRVVGRQGAGQARSPAGSAPARSRSTAAASTPWRPFGGYKQSGNGRELGKYGLEEFLETKSLQL